MFSVFLFIFAYCWSFFKLLGCTFHLLYFDRDFKGFLGSFDQGMSLTRAPIQALSSQSGFPIQYTLGLLAESLSDKFLDEILFGLGKFGSKVFIEGLANKR